MKCVVCKGPLVEETSRVYLGNPMHRIIGPGGRNQHPGEGTYCVCCGAQGREP